MRATACLALFTACLASQSLNAAEARFTLQTIEHRYEGGWEHFVGGGVAAFDCNGDGLPELYAAGGTNPAILLRNRSTADALSFAKDTPESMSLQGVTGAYPLDIDSDGHMDLVILRVGENLVMRGGPDCTFAPMPFESADKWTTAYTATWEAGENLPTLAFGNYVDRTNPEGPFEACDANALYRPDGGGWARTTLQPGYCALSMLFTDWGRRGRADLRVSNDRHYYVRGGSEQLWAMEPTPRLYSDADGWRDQAIWGMGIASRDITGDGLPEIYLTSMGDQKLQMLATDADGPAYDDARYERGATAHRPYTGGDGRPSTGWHAAFGDVDNDGRDDLFVAKGNVEQMPSNAMEDPNNLLMQSADGVFAEVGEAAGLASMTRGRGAALHDLNGDGLLDIVVVNRRAPLEIYQNVTRDAGGWLLLTLRQPSPNVDAVGAFIEVETTTGLQTREVTVGGGHASGSAGAHHFGLGDAERARVRVIWPGGMASDWRDLTPNQAITLERE